MRALEDKIGYRFSNPPLLKEALTHSSARSMNGGRDWERLEFLGDRVLGLCAAAFLFAEFPDIREADYARRYNRLVRKETCAEVSEALGLGPFIIMAPSEARSGGRKKAVILADACEAVLGAVFVDGGYDQAYAVMRRLWQPLLRDMDFDRVNADPKTALQEFAQSRGIGLPLYREVDRIGVDHAPYFIVEACVEGFAPSVGEGTALKKAQQAAAEAFLIREAVWPPAARLAGAG